MTIDPIKIRINAMVTTFCGGCDNDIIVFGPIIALTLF
jgi:hypothetical protein